LYFPELVGHTYNPSTQRWKQEEQKLEGSLDYTVRPCFKKPVAVDVAQWPNPYLICIRPWVRFLRILKKISYISI
jgi:hypothetical protein